MYGAGRDQGARQGRPAAGAAAGAAAPLHHLFVVVNGTRDSTAATVRVLQFMAHCKPWLARMRINFKIDKVPATLLATSDKLRAAFREKGITSFPALRTPRGTVRMGVRDIAAIYTRVIGDFKRMLEADQQSTEKTTVAVNRQGIEIGDASQEDIYRTFFAEDLTMEAAEDDRSEGDEGMSSSGNIMSQFQTMMKRRAAMDGTRSKRGNAYVGGKGRRSEKGAAPQADVADADSDAVIDRLIDTVVAPVDEGTLQRAFGSGGGADSARDDLMLSAYWENQSSSI